MLAVATEDSVPQEKLKPLAATLAIPLVRRMTGPYHDVGAVPTNYVIDRTGKLVYAKAAAFGVDSFNALVIPLLKEPVPEPPPPAPASSAGSAQATPAP